ncbi:L-dopachrome tautomerase-related protein [Pyxidicoccus trucidator]|uniref:L-dopachrome tautomerase-related protein n=1 Tax=Pyxidicoccus trucidator TaxID=2709662 RepID=UPI0013DCCD4F|nr:L-dopachrome tautomerase-related protein [Pyxidicoccus trucidator]
MAAPTPAVPGAPSPSPAAPVRRGSTLLKVVGAVVALLLLAALGVRLRYGGGAPYPDVTGMPLLPDSALEVAAMSPEPIGNLAVSSTGRLFFTIHPESRPEGAKLLEWVDGKAVPYPTAELQAKLFETPLGITIDRRDWLWTIDHGNHGMGTPRLLAFELATGHLAHEFVFPPDVAPPGSFLQDLRVDVKGDAVFIADVAFWRRGPGLVVYDVAAKQARRVLSGHPSVFPQDYIIRNPIKEMVFFGGLAALKAGVDGIAMDPSGEWVWFAAMNHDTMYRVRAADLRDASLGEAELEKRLHAVGRKPLNDGLSADVEGNVLITDVEHGAVLRMSPEGRLETLVKSPRIRWADALSHGPDGWVYLADSAIPHQMLQSKAHIAANAPYYIYRFKSGIAGVAGM